MSDTAEKSPLEKQLEAWARDASPEELQGAVGAGGAPGDAARAEIERRVEEEEHKQLLPPSIRNLDLDDPEQLLTDAIRLRRAALELYGEADIHMRSKQPRFRRANSVLEATAYLVGGNSVCTGMPNCECPACTAYLQWMHEDEDARAAMDAEERAAGGGKLT